MHKQEARPCAEEPRKKKKRHVLEKDQDGEKKRKLTKKLEEWLAKS